MDGPESRNVVLELQKNTIHCSGKVSRKALLAALKDASKSRDLEWGKKIHANAVEIGFDSDIFVSCSLINMYSKCSSDMAEARRVFDNMNFHDIASWNALAWGHTRHREGLIALQLLGELQAQGYQPNALTFVALIKACTNLAAKDLDEEEGQLASLEKGMSVHREAANGSFATNAMVASSLVEMYACCGSMIDAQIIFDKLLCRDVVLWTSLMLGYVRNGEFDAVFEIFQAMEAEGCEANSRTFLALVRACTSLAVAEEGLIDDVRMISLERGMAVHSHAAAKLRSLDLFLEGSLVEMYSSCRSMADARRIFDGMQKRDSVCWTSMIFGYVENREADSALDFFLEMQLDGFPPDVWTFVAAVKACASLVDLRRGRAVHEEISRHRLQNHSAVAASLVDFYSRCGSMAEAEEVFESVDRKDAVVWSALISGYSRQGNSDRVFELFDKMQKKVEGGLIADSITYLSVLTTCSRTGLVEKGKDCFEEMRRKSGLNPGIQHYHCMIDMLGRANQLDEALAMVESMPYEATAVTWTTVLSACCKWKNVAAGRAAFEKLITLDEMQDSSYGLMGNLYASVGDWEEKKNMDLRRRIARAKMGSCER